jgi:uncharacterized protein YwgA
MREREHAITAILDAGGGELTGRVRLQKTFYLLDQLGLDSGFDYEYHHYGPYSFDVENATADAKALGLVEEKLGRRQSDGATYSIFSLKEPPQSPGYGRLGRERAADLVHRFARTNITVLELAATVDWLWRAEKSPDWRSEVTRRKTLKVQNGRLDRAVELLSEIGLPPPRVA